MPDDEYVRLLFCNNCKTVQEIPDYAGPADHDYLLEYRVAEHQSNGIPHRGNLARCENKEAVIDATIREMENMVSPGGGAGLGQVMYDLKENYKAEAMQCWKRHGKTSNCDDYRSDKMRLWADTKAERKAEHLSTNRDERPNVWLCDHCFRGDTEVVTREGIQRIDDLTGKTPRLLVPNNSRWGTPSSRGVFIPTEVAYFGEQQTFDISLRKGRSRKTVGATAGHRWRVKAGMTWVVKTTAELSAGDCLQPLRAVSCREGIAEVPFGVAQGFIFGDGSHGHDDSRPAFLVLYDMNKDGALLPYFANHKLMQTVRGGTKVSSLPRHWKRLPPLDESRSFLLSWLAGYFAADGNVLAKGSAVLSSAERGNLEFVRSLLAVCGVGYSPVRMEMREGLAGRAPSALYRLSIRSQDLPPWFWKIAAHKERATRARSRHENHWVVSSVTEAGTEPVYCAIVPGAESFGLSDDLLTMNCVVHSLVQQRQRKDAGLYN